MAPFGAIPNGGSAPSDTIQKEAEKEETKYNVAEDILKSGLSASQLLRTMFNVQSQWLYARGTAGLPAGVATGFHISTPAVMGGEEVPTQSSVITYLVYGGIAVVAFGILVMLLRK